jgi:hypothetical protein
VGGDRRQAQRTRPGAAARLRDTCTRTAGVRHLFAAYELGEDKLYGYIKPSKTRPGSWNSAGTRPPPVRHPHRDHLRQLQPAPDHRQGRRVGTWAQGSGVFRECPHLS